MPVWIITTRVTIKAMGNRCVRSASVTAGMAGMKAGGWITPSTGTFHRSSTTAMAASAIATSAPGKRLSIFSDSVIAAKTKTPMTSACGLNPPILRPRFAMAPKKVEPPPGRPNKAGSCETTIWMAMPARKPVITGTDNSRAIQPSRSNPASAANPPTISASAAASAR